MEHHPDNGGSEDIIKEVNAEYDILFKRLKSDFEHKDTYKDATDKQKQAYDWQKDKLIREKVMQLAIFFFSSVSFLNLTSTQPYFSLI